MALINCPECGKEVSDMADVCIHCGYPLNEADDMIIKEKDVDDKQVKLVSIKKNLEGKQKKIISKKYKIIICFVFIMIFGVVIVKMPITEKQKDRRIWKVYFSEGYNAAVSQVYKYYGNSDKAIGLLMVMSDNQDNKVKDKIKVIEQNLDKDGKYYDYNVTLKNNSDSTVDYIKINIYLMDENKKIIHTDWTNWTGSLLPDASVKIDTMIDYVKGVKQYRVEIQEVNTK